MEQRVEHLRVVWVVRAGLQPSNLRRVVRHVTKPILAARTVAKGAGVNVFAPALEPGLLAIGDGSLN